MTVLSGILAHGRDGIEGIARRQQNLPGPKVELAELDKTSSLECPLSTHCGHSLHWHAAHLLSELYVQNRDQPRSRANALVVRRGSAPWTLPRHGFDPCKSRC